MPRTALLRILLAPLLLLSLAPAEAQPSVPGLDWADARREEARAAVPSREVLTADAKALSEAGWNPFFAFPQIDITGGRVRSYDWGSGAWREAELDAYLSGSPKWSPLFALASLNREGAPRYMPRPWSNLLCAPSGRRCLIAVTTGGFDEIRWLEVDTATQSLAEGGFDLPPSRGSVAWLSDDDLLISAGRTSTSGYPLEAKVWRRGTSMTEAKTAFSAGPGIDALFIGSEGFAGGRTGLILATRGTDPAALIIVGRDGIGRDLRLPVGFPQGEVEEQLAVSVTQDWRHRGRLYLAGSLLSFDLAALHGGRVPPPQIIFAPRPGAAVSSPTTSRAVMATRSAFYFTVLRDGGQEVMRATRSRGRWRTAPVIAERGGVATLIAADTQGEAALVAVESPISPPVLYRADRTSPELVRRASSHFDADGLSVERGFAVGKDGVRIPYWLIRKAGAQGPQPTIIHAYGAGNVPLLPNYRAEFGKLWLSRGGSYVTAQVRGGGEYGRAWHEAGARQRSGQPVDDLIAVAQALVAGDRSSPAKLGLFGLSAGGALVTSAATLRPDLFAAVVSQDGAVHPEAAAETAGSPARQEQLALLASEAGRRIANRYWPARAFSREQGCPNLLLTSWRGDQRVPAAESRALAAQHQAAGCRTLLFEQKGGDHGVSSAELLGITFGYFADRLGLPVR